MGPRRGVKHGLHGACFLGRNESFLDHHTSRPTAGVYLAREIDELKEDREPEHENAPDDQAEESQEESGEQEQPECRCTQIGERNDRIPEGKERVTRTILHGMAGLVSRNSQGRE